MLQYCPQYPLEIYEKSIPECGMSQVNFRERIGRILRDWIPPYQVRGRLIKHGMTEGGWRKIPLNPPLCKGGRYESFDKFRMTGEGVNNKTIC